MLYKFGLPFDSREAVPWNLAEGQKISLFLSLSRSVMLGPQTPLLSGRTKTFVSPYHLEKTHRELKQKNPTQAKKWAMALPAPSPLWCL